MIDSNELSGCGGALEEGPCPADAIFGYDAGKVREVGKPCGGVFAVGQNVLGTLHVVGGFTHKGLDRIKSVSRVKVADLGGVNVLLELLLKERGGAEVPGKRSEVTVGIRFGSQDNANWGVVADA